MEVLYLGSQKLNVKGKNKLGHWRQDYNQARPHSALDDNAPAAFAARWAETAAACPEANPDGPESPQRATRRALWPWQRGSHRSGSLGRGHDTVNVGLTGHNAS
jgi:hypothetical protein